MKPTLRIENKQCMKVMVSQPQMEMVSDIKLLQESIARDLHDDLSQYLTTMSLYISGILSSSNLDSAHNNAVEMNAVNSEMGYSLKRLLANLRSDNFLYNYSRTVIKEDYFRLLKDWEQLNTSILLKYRLVVPSELDTETLSQCYQILKEALSNISRHAHAKHVSVHIGKNINSLQIKISDDGIGFQTTDLEKYKFGLLGMKERAKQIGAIITINSAPNHGTNIFVDVPLDLILYE